MGRVTVFRNCLLLRNHQIIKEDLWIDDGTIINPEKLFFEQKKNFDEEINCHGCLIAPGLIDLQINGGFGVDFTFDIKDQQTAESCLQTVGKGLLAHGVTSYCPTLVTSPRQVYSRVLPWLQPTKGGLHGPEVLGAHVEGPFISKKKKGAHKEEFIVEMPRGYMDIRAMYGPSIGNVRIITLAPELDPEGKAVEQCVERGITVSVGHSMATLNEGENAVRKGARLITHLFNAMVSFHHRDPGLLGLLTSRKLEGHEIFYGIIADGIHTHPAALRVAYRTNFNSLCLVTDAITALGFKDGIYNLGEMSIEVQGQRAVIAGTDTLCGAIASMLTSVKKLIKGARCTLVEALEAASLHPAQALQISKKKGTLEFGSDADFIMLDKNNVKLISTWIGGECVFKS